MRSQRTDLWLSALSALAGLVLGLLAFRLAGFLGVGILGLLIGFIAVRIDLEKEGAVSGPFSTGLYAQQIAMSDNWERLGGERLTLMRSLQHAMPVSARGFARRFSRASIPLRCRWISRAALRASAATVFLPGSLLYFAGELAEAIEALASDSCRNANRNSYKPAL